MSLAEFGVEVKDKKPKAIEDKKLDFSMQDVKSNLTNSELERYLPWFIKYKVENFEDLIVTSEIKKLIKYVENPAKTKSILLVGPPGSGKTTTVNLISEHYDFELFELNASDSRNKKSIDESLGEVVKQTSLFGKDKLILIDEVDGVSGKDDRGGVSEIVKIMKSSKYPVILTANDKESEKIKPLKKVADFVDFENHSLELLFNLGEKIFKEEMIEYSKEDLQNFIEKRSSSDIRGFINDLQASVIESKFTVSDSMEIRDYKKKIEYLLDKIYFSYPEDALKSNYFSDIFVDDILLYLEENTPSVFQDINSTILAFNEISKADLFKGRILKWQYWRYLVYINFYLTYGVASSKSKVKKIPYKRNQRILKKWIYGNKVNSLRPRTKAEKQKDVELRFIERVAKFYGRSANRVRKDDIMYFIFQYQNDKSFQKEMDTKLNITADVKKTIEEF